MAVVGDGSESEVLVEPVRVLVNSVDHDQPPTAESDDLESGVQGCDEVFASEASPMAATWHRRPPMWPS